MINDSAQSCAKKKKRVLLTGARSPCALELSRHLHHGGHTIFAADTTTMHVLKFSNTLEKFYAIPSPRFDCPGFIAELSKIIVDERIDVLIPVWEEVLYLSLYKDQLPKTCEVFCSSFQQVHQLHHKWLFIKMLNSFGIKAPNSVLLRSEKDLKEFIFEPPYVLKKCFSRGGSRSVTKIMTAEPPNIKIESDNPWIAQEFIKGKNRCSFSVCYQGKVLAHAAYPVEYTLDGSCCIAFEAIENPKILNWVKNLVSKMGYTGQIAFDFIETSQGELYAIECNPRATSGLHLFAPDDLIERAYFHQTDQIITPCIGNSQQIMAAMLMYGIASGLAEKKLGAYVKKMFSTKDIIFSFKDIKPFIFHPVVLASYWLSSKKQGRPIPALFTYDLEWNKDI